MLREKYLFKNTIILTLGKIFTQLVTFLLLPLYTAILSTEEFGIVDLLNTLVSLLIPIVTLQIEQALFRSLIEYRNNDEKKKISITTGIFAVVIQIVIYLIIFIVFSPIIKNTYKFFLVTNVIAYIWASLFQQIARGMGYNRDFAIGSFISGIITIIVTIILLIPLKLGAYGMLIGNMCGQIACVVYIFIKLKLYNFINLKFFDKKILNLMYKYSFPLVPNAISWWVFNASDRIIVSTILGVGQNGILSAAHKFSALYISLYSIFNMSWTETIALHIEDDDIEDFFNKIFNIVFNLFLAIAILIIAIMPFIYEIFINYKYYTGYYQVPIMMIGSIFNIFVGLLGAIYVAKKNTKAIANNTLISAILNIIIHLCLIKYIGLYAATLSTFLAYFIMSIYRIYDIKKKYFNFKIDKHVLTKTIIILTIILISYYINYKILSFIVLMFTILYAININNKSINQIIFFARKKICKYKYNE